ncbi:hypothetical protein ACVWXO_001905 [Bradyrhizobium sp. LM2.7]
MAKILIEGTNVGGILNNEHLLLIYQADDGQEFVIRGGNLNSILTLEVNRPIAESADAQYDANNNLITPNALELSIGNRSAADVWNLLIQYANNINQQHLSYDSLSQNSNSVVGNLLNLIGINVDDVYATDK